MREAVIALDEEHRIQFANQSACNLFNWSSIPQNQPIQEVLKVNTILQFLQEKAASEAPWVEIETEKKQTLLARLTTQSYTQEEVLVISDITALRRLETVRRDFVANVSHELRTPTTVIQINAETLMNGALEDPKMSRVFLDAIYRNAQRLSALVSDLLDLSRIESGTYTIEPCWINAYQVICHVVDALADQLIDKSMKIKIKIDPQLEVYADKQAFEQIMTNLIENAIKYSFEQGKIKVVLKEDPQSDQKLERDGLTFEVIDEGPGISPKHQTRLFERFYRIDTGRSRKRGGTGLGLAIVKHLCQNMEGKVGVHSEEGKGSSFWFTLPLPVIVNQDEKQ